MKRPAMACVIPLILTTAATCLFSPILLGQQLPPMPKIPEELQARNPDVRTKLSTARSDRDSGKYDEAFAADQQALEIARKAGFSGDIALAEHAMATAELISGKVEAAWDLERDALQKAVESSNFVLQADILTSLSAYSQNTGGVKGALSLLVQALGAAEKSKSLYIKSRVLGEMGRLQLLAGDREQAKKSLDEALRIDSLNKYQFYALHLVYQTYFLLSENQTVKEGIQELEKARVAAVSDRNYVALVMAEMALGNEYVHIGDPQRGIGILESMRSGDIEVSGGTDETQAEFRAVLALPFVHASLLETVGNAYEAAKRTSDAIAAWTELYSFSSETQLTFTDAEAALHLAGLYAVQTDYENAAKYYHMAAVQWQVLGNEEMLLQSLAGEADSLTKTGQSVKALAVENQIAQLGLQLKARRAEFLAYLAMAEIYQPTNHAQEAKTALEKAQALIEPGPDDPALGYKTVTELYLRLSAIYEKTGDQEKQLAAIEKALAVSIAEKDQDQTNILVATLRQKFDAIHVEALISNLYKANKLLEALTYSQLLFVFQGVPADTPAGKGHLYLQLVGNAPFQIALKEGGGRELEQDLELMGTILGFQRWPVLQALSQQYVFSGRDLGQIEKGRDYAQQALALIDQTKSLISPQGLRIHSVCTLAVAYARTKDPELANQTIQSCMDLEKQSSNTENRNFANVANVFVHIFNNDLAKAQESLSYLQKTIGANPAGHEELAIAFGSAGRISEAMAEFAVALDGYQASNDTASSAKCYKEMASVLDSSTSPESKKKQLDFLNKALSLYKRTGDTFQESGTDVALAQYFAKLGDTRHAEHWFQQSLEAAKRSGNKTAVGWACLTFGNFRLANKHPEQAPPLHEEAAAAFQAAKAQAEEAQALLAVGLDMQSIGHLDEALREYFKAQTVADESGQSSSQYFARIDIGFLYERKGQMDQARTAFLKAAQIAESAHDLANLARCDLDLAGLDTLEGDWQSALENATKAQKLFHQIADPEGESDADAELGGIYSERTSTVQDFELARKYFAAAQKLHYSQLTELGAIEIDIQTKHFTEAAATARNVLAGCRHTGSVAWDNGDACTANALISLAEAERLSGDLKASAAALRKAKPLLSKIQDIYSTGRLLYGEANREWAEGDFGEAAGLYRQVIQLVEDTKANIDPEFQLSMSETYDFVYDELIDCLYSLSEQEKGSQKLQTSTEALGYAETNKARQFGKSWGRTFVTELRRKLPLDVVQQEDMLTARRNRAAAQLHAAISEKTNSSGGGAELQKQLAHVDSDLQNFVHMLQRQYPDYAALKYPQPTALASIPLRPGETLVEFKMTDAATFVWIIRGDETKGTSLISFYRVPEPRAWFRTQISKVRDAFNSGQPEGYDPQISEKLFDKLFPGQQAHAILESQRLIFIPDGVLYLLPFEMLSPDAGRGNYMLLSVPTMYFPSAESLRIARAARRPEHWKEAFLGVGDPITSPSDPRYPLVTALSFDRSSSPQGTPTAKSRNAPDQVAKLKARGFQFDRIPGTAKEIQAIADLFSEKHEKAEILLGVTAMRKDLLDLDLSKFRYIHFATHGILPVDAGVREPSLVLSYDGTTTDDMLLPISTIMGLNIDADDVVLSACNTGSGKVTRAEGVMSLGRAFMVAGASSVTVSLWEVSDASTALLMEQYYRNLLQGKPKDVALSEARTWLFHNGHGQPYFWAPFILIGQ